MLATDYCTALSKGRDEGQGGFCNAFSATAKHLSAELRGVVDLALWLGVERGGVWNGVVGYRDKEDGEIQVVRVV